MKQTVLAGLAITILAGVPHLTSLHGQASSNADMIESTRATIEQWVNIRQSISKERTEWLQEKQLIESRIAVYQEEIETREKNLAALEERISGAEKGRAELRSQADQLQRASRAVSENIGSYERRVQRLAKAFPPPLQEKVSRLLAQITDPNRQKTDSSRTLAVIGILNEADTFNNQITMRREPRELPDGKLAEVNAIYFGLGIAYYVDAQGLYAGIGTPTPDGWTWKEQPEIAPQVARITQYYSARGEAAFVEAPVQITDLSNNLR